MAYRNGTYIAFHAGGTTNPTASDIKYYRLMKAWHEHDDIEFQFINSHDKVAGVRDSSAKATLRRSLLERLSNSKNMILIIGDTTKNDTDWVPFEIERAVDSYGLPIIAVYPGTTFISDPSALKSLWPAPFAKRISAGTVRSIHIPFKQVLIDKAIREFSIKNMPRWPNTVYNSATYRSFGLPVS